MGMTKWWSDATASVPIDATGFDHLLNMADNLITPAEADLLYDSGLAIQARNILEVGARKGGSSMILGMLAKETGGHVQSIEVHPREVWYENIEKAGLEEYVTLIEGESPWINPDLIEKPIDLLLVDGEHYVPECLVDYWFWNRYLRSGGIVCFHDWTGRKRGTGGMIQHAVALIRERHKLIEVGRTEGQFGLIVFSKS